MDLRQRLSVRLNLRHRVSAFTKRSGATSVRAPQATSACLCAWCLVSACVFVGLAHTVVTLSWFHQRGPWSDICVFVCVCVSFSLSVCVYGVCKCVSLCLWCETCVSLCVSVSIRRLVVLSLRLAEFVRDFSMASAAALRKSQTSALGGSSSCPTDPGSSSAGAPRDSIPAHWGQFCTINTCADH